MNNLDDIIDYLKNTGQTEMADRLKGWQSRHTRLKGEYMGMLRAIEKSISVNVYVEGDKVKVDGPDK